MVAQQEIELKLKAFDHKMLDKAIIDIVGTVSRIGVKYRGPIPMPRKIDKYTVNRSTHIDKKARDQFEIRSHTRLLFIEAFPEAVDALMKLDIAAGVDIKIKMREG